MRQVLIDSLALRRGGLLSLSDASCKFHCPQFKQTAISHFERAIVFTRRERNLKPYITKQKPIKGEKTMQ